MSKGKIKVLVQIAFNVLVFLVVLSLLPSKDPPYQLSAKLPRFEIFARNKTENTSE
jgi:hypothetical protein